MWFKVQGFLRSINKQIILMYQIQRSRLRTAKDKLTIRFFSENLIFVTPTQEAFPQERSSVVSLRAQLIRTQRKTTLVFLKSI